MGLQIDPSRFLSLTLGMKRSEVFHHLGIPISEQDYPKGFFEKLLGKVLGAETDLDHGPGYTVMPPAKVFPFLNLQHSHGVEIYFDKQYQMKSIWFEPPFALPVSGVKLGDTEQSIVAARGTPTMQQAEADYHMAFWYDAAENGTAVVYRFRDQRVAEIAYGYKSEV